jgi:hypothetical protein
LPSRIMSTIASTRWACPSRGREHLQNVTLGDHENVDANVGFFNDVKHNILYDLVSRDSLLPRGQSWIRNVKRLGV